MQWRYSWCYSVIRAAIIQMFIDIVTVVVTTAAAAAAAADVTISSAVIIVVYCATVHIGAPRGVMLLLLRGLLLEWMGGRNR